MCFAGWLLSYIVNCLLVVMVPVAGAVGRPVLAWSVFTPAALAQIGFVSGHRLWRQGGLLCDWWLVTPIFIILSYMQEQVK